MLISARSKALRNVPHLGLFLKPHTIVNPIADMLHLTRPEAIAGWAADGSSSTSLERARRLSLPYLRIGYGPLFSTRHMDDSQITPSQFSMSIVIDNIGIYLDAASSSRFEELVLEAAEDPFKLGRGLRLGALMKQERISRYTIVQSNPIETTKPIKLLLLDERVGDAAVAGAMADKTTFKHMLDAAVLAFGTSDIAILPPENAYFDSGESYLRPLAAEYGIAVLAPQTDPYDAISNCNEVWTVSSHTGLTALMLEKEVRCFGAAFYSGWGLTDDGPMDAVARDLIFKRRAPTSLNAVLWATFVGYPRYIDPFGFEQIEAEKAVQFLAALRTDD